MEVTKNTWPLIAGLLSLGCMLVSCQSAAVPPDIASDEAIASLAAEMSAITDSSDFFTTLHESMLSRLIIQRLRDGQVTEVASLATRQDEYGDCRWYAHYALCFVSEISSERYWLQDDLPRTQVVLPALRALARSKKVTRDARVLAAGALRFVDSELAAEVLLGEYGLVSAQQPPYQARWPSPRAAGTYLRDLGYDVPIEIVDFHQISRTPFYAELDNSRPDTDVRLLATLNAFNTHLHDLAAKQNWQELSRLADSDGRDFFLRRLFLTVEPQKQPDLWGDVTR